MYDYIEKIAVTRDLIDRAIHFAISTQEYEKRLKESAKQAESVAKYNHDLLTFVSSEMRAPLGAMISCSDIVAEHADKNIAGDAAEKVAFAARQVEGFLLNLADLVRLDYSASDGSGNKFVPAEFIQDAIDALAVNDTEVADKIKLELDAPQTTALRGDGLRLRSVAVTLLKNALRQSQGGDVCASASYRGGVFSFRVESSGAAQDAEHKPDLRDDTPSSGDAKDAWQGRADIGLAVCKRLLDQMDGTLVFESASSGGSIAGFDVPLSSATDQAA